MKLWTLVYNWLCFELARDPTRIKPSTLILATGQATFIRCTSETPVTWLFNGSKILPSNVIPIEDYSNTIVKRIYSLYIHHANSANTGIYTCKGEYNNIIFDSDGKVKVKGNFLKFISTIIFVLLNNYTVSETVACNLSVLDKKTTVIH